MTTKTITRNTATPRHHRRCAGLSLVETLIALSISALLLSATAMAFDAAFTTYRVNHDLAMASMAARNSVYQMCATIRSAWNDPAYDTIDVASDGTTCSLVDAGGRDVAYWYDETTHTLKVSADLGANWYVMLDNVSPIATGQPIFAATDPATGDFATGTVGCVDIQFQVQQGQTNRPVSASVVPRNVLYASKN